eukprot:2953267-Amphidinium_carterae.1
MRTFYQKDSVLTSPAALCTQLGCHQLAAVINFGQFARSSDARPWDCPLCQFRLCQSHNKPVMHSTSFMWCCVVLRPGVDAAQPRSGFTLWGLLGKRAKPEVVPQLWAASAWSSQFDIIGRVVY